MEVSTFSRSVRTVDIFCSCTWRVTCFLVRAVTRAPRWLEPEWCWSSTVQVSRFLVWCVRQVLPCWRSFWLYFEKVVGRVRCGRHGPVCFAPHDVLNVSTFTVGVRNRFALFLCRGTDAGRSSHNSLNRSGCVVVVDL